MSKRLLIRAFPAHAHRLPAFLTDADFADLQSKLETITADLPAEPGPGHLSIVLRELRKAYLNTPKTVWEAGNDVMYRIDYDPEKGYVVICCRVSKLHVGQPPANPFVVEVELMEPYPPEEDIVPTSAEGRSRSNNTEPARSTQERAPDSV